LDYQNGHKPQLPDWKKKNNRTKLLPMRTSEYFIFKAANALFLSFLLTAQLADARPMVRNIRSAHEFDRLLSKHAKETGLPVIVDFYSDGCGPCRMMAPKFKQKAASVGQDKAVFVKVDTNVIHDLSSRYQVRSLPTFMFFLNNQKVNEFKGASEQQLNQMTDQIVRQSEIENVKLTRDELVDYYKQVDESKDQESIDSVYNKCAGMTKGTECVGNPANQLARKLKKKYGKAPKTVTRFAPEDRKPGAAKENKTEESKTKSSKKSDSSKPNLHLASKEDLLEELERRQAAEEEAREDEEEDEEAAFGNVWTPGDFPERVTIIGGGPAGMSAAIYAARAGLSPVVVAPPMGGQLEGKGVEVENYPGLHNMTGPGVVSSMRHQASLFGTSFEMDVVVSIDASKRPFKVKTNSSIIETHAIILATGAESKWLNIPGEWEMRGGGVSSCATCDGAVYRGKHVLVVGGGDTAMEDALVLARTSDKVTVIHRRDQFRASKVLAQRVIEHPSITVRWNTTLKEILGKDLEPVDDEEENVDLDDIQKVVSGAVLVDIGTNEETRINCDAVFVAIGHVPSTSFVQGIVEFEEDRPGYVKTFGSSTRTSVPGIFAAGDVADSVYRQAITSAGSGAAAALDAERWLSEEGLGNEAAEFEAELLAELMGSADAMGASSYNAYEEAGGKMEGMRESVNSEL